jgi:metallo-beta-lactamase family protein
LTAIKRTPTPVSTKENMVKLSFHGADRDVTGSCHLVECAGKRVLIDCGLYQGSREIAQENAGDFGFDPAGIDFVLLTHAHLDHCGRLPLLAKRGFGGTVITTAATRELARLVMLDSAHLQEEGERANTRRGARSATSQKEMQKASLPLYTVLDALNSLDAFGRTALYGPPIELAKDIRAIFVDAGHILGSASIQLELTEAGKSLHLLFSGDIGNAGHPLLKPSLPPPRADVVVMETTYGDRLHKPMGASIDELYEAITDTFMRGGNVIIPTFALERAQELLWILNQGILAKRLTPAMQVFLDSPMAISATEIFARHSECLTPEAARLFKEGHDPLQLPGLRFVRERAESTTLNNIRGGAVIMAGSGMATGGRVRHHLKHNIWRADCSVVFVGFAAKGTLARQIIDGQSPVRIFAEDIPVKAKIYTINGFSAHADQAELLAWHRHTGADRTFLTHGEEPTMQQFAARLVDTRVEIPMLHQSFEL